jgi:hypothetical protein
MMYIKSYNSKTNTLILSNKPCRYKKGYNYTDISRAGIKYRFYNFTYVLEYLGWY